MESVAHRLLLRQMRGYEIMESDLVQELPSGLKAALLGASIPGETTVIALRGAMGEALVVTDKRAIILREGQTGDADVYPYPLASVTGAAVDSTTAGGLLRIETRDNPPSDRSTVYFPIVDLGKFEVVASMIKEMTADREMRKPSAQAVTSADACPSCGTAVGERSVFCAGCGENLRDICQFCSAALPDRATFCPGCGTPATPVVTKCPACGERANSAVMTYCVHCGRSLSPKCAECGAPVVPGYSRCRYCGRSIGSDEGTMGRDFRGHVQRMRQEEEQETNATAIADEPEPVEEESMAAKHNAKGARLFDEEKTEEAIEEFRRAVVLEPNDGSYHCNLAVAYDEVDQDEDARREYERALELNPDDTTALLYLGYMLNENADPKRAAELWRRLIEIAPGTPEAEEAQQNLRAQESL